MFLITRTRKFTLYNLPFLIHHGIRKRFLSRVHRNRVAGAANLWITLHNNFGRFAKNCCFSFPISVFILLHTERFWIECTVLTFGQLNKLLSQKLKVSTPIWYEGFENCPLEIFSSSKNLMEIAWFLLTKRTELESHLRGKVKSDNMTDQCLRLILRSETIQFTVIDYQNWRMEELLLIILLQKKMVQTNM